MARRRLSTSDYSPESRRALGKAVASAREAAGFRSRSALADAANVGLRSIDKLELGDPEVGQRILFAVGRVLPNWTEDTPKHVLDGGAPPPNGGALPPGSPGADAVPPDWTEHEEQRWTEARQVLQALRLLPNLTRWEWRDMRADFDSIEAIARLRDSRSR